MGAEISCGDPVMQEYDPYDHTRQKECVACHANMTYLGWFHNTTCNNCYKRVDKAGKLNFLYGAMSIITDIDTFNMSLHLK